MSDEAFRFSTDHAVGGGVAVNVSGDLGASKNVLPGGKGGDKSEEFEAVNGGRIIERYNRSERSIGRERASRIRPDCRSIKIAAILPR